MIGGFFYGKKRREVYKKNHMDKIGKVHLSGFKT